MTDQNQQADIKSVKMTSLVMAALAVLRAAMKAAADAAAR